MLIDYLKKNGLEIGDKIKLLIAKGDAIIQSGGFVNKRMILPGRLFRRFVGVASENSKEETLEEKIKTGTFSDDEVAILSKVGKRFGDIPLMIRMSALEGQYGLGIDKSTASPSSTKKFLDSIKYVLASYFSPDGIAFREGHKLEESFGISVEPLLGQRLGWFGYVGDVFAPILSGVGYSSGCNGGLRIICASGLFGAVDEEPSIILDEGDDFSLSSAVEEYWMKMTGHIREKNNPDDTVLAGFWLNQVTKPCGRFYAEKIFEVEDFIDRHTLILERYEFDPNLFEHMNNFRIKDIFDIIERIQDKEKKPQYVEFAYLLGRKGPVIVINQIADEIVREGGLNYIPKNDSRVVLDGECKSGEVDEEIKYIIFCKSQDDINQLHEINRSKEKYVAVIPTSLMNKMSVGESMVRYGDYSNATGIFTDDNKNLGTHFPEIFNVTEKILAVQRGGVPQLREEAVYEGRFRVLGSVEDRYAQVYELK